MITIHMPYDFNDAELYPCDICGEAFPVEEMFELPDGRLVCEECLNKME